MDAADDATAELAARQHGLITRQQARTLGWTRAALAHRLRRGDWVAAGPRVLRRAGAPSTVGQRLLVAVLDAGPGAVLARTTAAAWWGLPGFAVDPLHVARPRHINGTRARFARLHEALDLLPQHVTVFDGVPIVRPERMIFELCGAVHPRRAERALDNAWSRGLLSGGSLRRVHAELSERGRKGTVLLRELLEARGPAYVPPASALEARLQSIVEGAGVTRLRRQVDIGASEWAGRVDFRDEVLPLVVEVQSERFHSSLCDKVADAERAARLAAAGLTVIEVTDVEVWHQPSVVVERVAQARLTLNRLQDRAS